jgi:hypothetical protein
MITPLEQAITIWRGRAAINDLEDYDYTLCPLCEEHPECRGCPVFRKTGQQLCEATPFHDAFIARVINDDLPEFKAKATEMVAFLESCR